jgi:UDP-N-acetylglucosamine 2-epimerase (non-hydrolysing)
LIFFVLGTTAELIKLSPILSGLDSRRITYTMILTGQQGSDLNHSLNEFSFQGKIVNLVKRDQPLTSKFSALSWFIQCLSNVLWKNVIFDVEANLCKTKTLVVVHGDTLSTFIGAFLARRLRFPLAHVEAGLRSYDFFNPFPEELVRVFVSKFSAYNFAPTPIAIDNLSVAKGKNILTFGNTAVDAMSIYPPSDDLVNEASDYCVVLLHRTEFLSNSKVLKASVADISEVSSSLKVKLVVDSITRRYFLPFFKHNQNIQLIQKMGYREFQKLLHGASFIITDSGGLQEECAEIGKPCLVHRKATERGDGLGTNAVLSDWVAGEMLSFSKNFIAYSTPKTIRESSPTKIILQELESEGFI